MKFYLSSYKIGNSGGQLAEFFVASKNKKIAYLPNARDFVDRSPEKIEKQEYAKQEDIKNLENLGLEVELLDLVDFFGKPEKLSEKLSEFSGVFISGGNTFVLRRAFALSGFDAWIQKNISSDFIYAGYSAACCILSPSLKGLQIVDDPEKNPYAEDASETPWKGLGILNYAFLPHYDSDHHESADIAKEIQHCIENKVPFKAFRDGEVEIFEKI